MLVLSRKDGEEICIGSDVRIEVISIVGNRVRLGIHAPREIPVLRGEISDSVSRHGSGLKSSGLKTGQKALPSTPQILELDIDSLTTTV